MLCFPSAQLGDTRSPVSARIVRGISACSARGGPAKRQSSHESCGVAAPKRPRCGNACRLRTASSCRPILQVCPSGCLPAGPLELPDPPHPPRTAPEPPTATIPVDQHHPHNARDPTSALPNPTRLVADALTSNHDPEIPLDNPHPRLLNLRLPSRKDREGGDTRVAPDGRGDKPPTRDHPRVGGLNPCYYAVLPSLPYLE